MDATGVPVLIAFVAGVLSFLSPCQLAVVPAYVGYLSGSAVGVAGSRARTVGHAAIFVAGFSLVFILLGASVGLVGYLVYDYVPLLRRVGGLVLIVFGLHFLGLLKIPLLYREAKLGLAPSPKRGLGASLLLGVVFGVGWTPCIGPTLAAILLLASATQTVGQGAALLAVYSVGLGVPFLATAFALESASRLLRRINRHGNVVTLVSGVLLILMGILIFTNRVQQLSGLFGGWVPFNL